MRAARTRGPAALLGRALAAVTGPRGRLVTIAVWIVVAAAGFVGQRHLNDVTSAGQSSFLPAKSESTRVVHLLKTRFGGGENVPLFVIFECRGGLTRGDRVAIGRIGRRLERLGLDGATPVYDGLTTTGSATLPGRVGLIAPDGQAAIVALGIDASHRGAISLGVTRIRRLLQGATPRASRPT